MSGVGIFRDALKINSTHFVFLNGVCLMRKIAVVFPNDVSAHLQNQISAYSSLNSIFELHAIRYPTAALSNADFSVFKTIYDVTAKKERDTKRLDMMRLSLWTNRKVTALFDHATERYFWIYYGRCSCN